MNITEQNLSEGFRNLERMGLLKGIIKKEVKEIIEHIWVKDKIDCEKLLEVTRKKNESNFSLYSIDRILHILFIYNFFSNKMIGNYEIFQKHAAGISSIMPSIIDKGGISRKLYFTDIDNALAYAEAFKKIEHWEDVMYAKYERV